MVDNRAAGFYGIAGSFNFRSGDISGTAAGLSDDKMGQGSEYSRQRKSEEENLKESNIQFSDRSAQLRATLNSLAMMNVAGVINTMKRPSRLNEEKEEFDEHEFYEKTKDKRKELILENSLIDEDSEEEHKEKNSSKSEEETEDNEDISEEQEI